MRLLAGSVAIDLLHAALVTSTLERRRHPDVHYCQRLVLTEKSLPQGQNVCIIVRPAQPRRLFVPAESAPNAADPIRNNRFAIT
jgi:hypothetical protein